jgi:hypothetical protein
MDRGVLSLAGFRPREVDIRCCNLGVGSGHAQKIHGTSTRSAVREPSPRLQK